MRISLINLNLVAQDAIGKCILDQVHYFRRRGDEVQIYVAHSPQGVSEDVAALTRVVTLADLLDRREAHFARSDLYIYHYPGRHALMESIKGIERGAVIFYYHNVTPPDLWGSTTDLGLLRHSQGSASALAHYADLIVSASRFSADQLVDERDRIRVLPYAVPLDQFSPGPRDLDLLQHYNLQDKQVVLFVGRMAGNKRVDLLVEALALMPPRTALLLVGDDRGNAAIQETVAKIRARAAELGLTDRIVMTGLMSDLPKFYRSADVYASASLHEGFGVPLIEAMASGLPVVASRATAHPEVVGEAGLLVEPDNAADLAEKITRVLADDALCGELVQRGLARAKEFSLERYEHDWAVIVAEATAWLPDQPIPRPRSLATQPAAPATGSAVTIDQAIRRGDLKQLEAKADVMIRGYSVRSNLPVVGRLIAWVRRNATSHLREPYLDPMVERQVAFNRDLEQALAHIVEDSNARLDSKSTTWRHLSQKQQELEERLMQIDAWLGLISAQMSLLQATRSGSLDSEGLAEVQRQIEALRRSLTAR